MAAALEECLVLSYWFEVPPTAAAGPVTLRFSGHRIGVGARTVGADHFVHDETVDGVVPGGGPVSVTARIQGVSSGDWAVDATVVDTAAGPPRPRRGRAAPLVQPHRVAWSWRRWSLSEGPPVPLHTCPAPFAHVPGLVRGAWAAMVGAGIAVALATLATTASRTPVDAGPVLPVSLIALFAGIVGAKLWFVVLHHRDHRMEGWCVQGLVAGVVVAVALSVLVASIPVGVVLDLAAPGLFLGLAVGRVGCFLAGCCAGRPTARRWGIWSSDRRVGLRRVPTQLMESSLSLAIGGVALAIVLGHGPAHGGIFAGALAAYTLVRQGILRLRAEARMSSLGAPLAATAAVVALAGDILVHAGALQHLTGAA